jgi:hypothetical protein
MRTSHSLVPAESTSAVRALNRRAVRALLWASCAAALCACHDWDALVDELARDEQPDDGGMRRGPGSGSDAGDGGRDAGCIGPSCEPESPCAALDTPCGENETCVDRGTDGYACECDPGFALDGGTCADIDECADPSAHDCDPAVDACVNLTGGSPGYMCRCPSGYTGSGMGEDSCRDVDECAVAVDPCGPHGVCNNTDGGYDCVCTAGYEDDGTTCVDVDECAQDNGGCETTCENTPGGHVCRCAPGEILDDDGTSCSGRTWGAALTIDDEAEPASVPQVAVNSAGAAVAVWVQSAAVACQSYPSAFAATFAPSTGWAAPQHLSATGNCPTVRVPQVAIDGSGNAMAVWEEDVGGPADAFASRRPAGSGFTAGIELSTDDMNSARAPHVAAGSNGDVLIAYHQAVGTDFNIRAHLYSGTGWTHFGEVEMDPDRGTHVHVAVGNPGRGFLVWQQLENSEDSVWGMALDLSSGTGTPRQLGTGNQGSANLARVAANASGNAVAIWKQWNGVAHEIWATHFRNDAFQPAGRVDRRNGGTDAPQVAMDAAGNAIAVWADFTGTAYEVWSARMSSAGTWSNAARIDDGAASAETPRLAMNASGNAVAIWAAWTSGSRDVRAAIYTAGAGWGSPVPVESAPADAYAPAVGMDAQGHAIAVWLQAEAQVNVKAARLQ